MQNRPIYFVAFWQRYEKVEQGAVHNYKPSPIQRYQTRFCTQRLHGEIGRKKTLDVQKRDGQTKQELSALVEMGDRLATTHGKKIVGCAPLGGAGSRSNTMSPGPTSISLPSGILIHPAVRPQQTWAENWGGLCPYWGVKPGSPYNKMCRGQGVSPCRFILIDPALWSQYTNVTSDRPCT